MNKVSVIIPVYNVSEWIVEAVDSIIKQTYQDIEIIIIDDCSKDNTYELLCQLKDQDDRIKIFKNSENSKIVKTLNFGLNHATGDYILRQDGDDVSLPSRLETLMSFLLENQLDLVGSQMLPIDEIGRVIGEVSRLPVGNEKVNKAIEYGSPITHIWLAKREVYEKLKNYREIPYAEDYDFIARAIDSGFRCDNVDLPLIKIRHRNGNTSDVASLVQRKGSNYALKLHKQRVKYGKDFYSLEDANRCYNSNLIEKKFHTYSTFFLKKAFNSKSTFLKIIYTLLTCVLSPYNFQYLYSRVKFKSV